MGYLTVKKAPTKQNRFFRIAGHKHLLPLVAAGGGLAAGPATAIELGDVVVQSRLGQPLRASIAYALAPNEQISSNCVFLGRSTSGLPGIGRATLSVADGRILLSGETALREPMVATRVVVNCPYTANLSRDYMMFVDPASPVYEATPAALPAAPAAVSTPQRTVAPVAPVADRQPIGKSTRYQVQRGDSLSVIAQRIENRPLGLWPAVNAIFAANPDAFMDNDPNKLKAGSWLEIPSFDGSEPIIASAAPPAEAAPQASAYAGIVEETVQPAANEPAIVDSTPPVETEAPVASTAEATVVEESADTTGDLRPGDIILDDGTVSAADSIVIPDVELDGPETASSSPNVPTAIIDTSNTAEQPQSPWLLWFAGGGAAIIVALLMFGSRLRRRPAPAGAVGLPGEVPADDTESIETFVDDEYDLDDDSPTAENLALDADLFVGTGLEEGTDMEVSEIFGIPGPTEVDIELPFEPEAPAATMETDIIPPVNTDGHSILESEILPDDDDYDMSVIVDATKMPRPEDVTERDLQAIEVEAAEDDADTDSYTINREADFDVLEQDYEDEMTATQALNQEIARAAAELESRVDEDEEITSEMPLATVTELGVTAQLPRRGDEDTDDTVESESPTVNTASDEKTAEMSASGNEDTVEMDVESGKVGTRDA